MAIVRDSKYLQSVLFPESVVEKKSQQVTPFVPRSFEYLHSPTGVQNSKHWFSLKSADVSNTWTEDEFLYFMRKATTMDDSILLDIFDYMDVSMNGRLAYDEFYLVISSLMAWVDACTARFLHVHGKQLFKVVGRGSETINYEQMSFLGRLMGLSDSLIAGVLQKYGFTELNEFDYTKFELYYFAITKNFDKYTDGTTPEQKRKWVMENSSRVPECKVQ